MTRTSPQTPNRAQRRWATRKTAAAYASVGERTIRQWIADGLINGYRVNSRVIRVDLNEIDDVMQPFGGAA